MKKNIMFVVPTLCGGGAEKTVANLTKYLSDYYNVFIVAFRKNEIEYDYSGKVFYLSNKSANNYFSKIIFLFNSIFKLKKMKKDYHISYSISFLATADLVNVLSKANNTKNYISIRNTDSMYTKNTIYSIFTKISCKKCNHIVSISNQVKLDLINNFGVKSDKITTIYNPALKIEFGDKKNDDVENYDNYIVNVGRLTKQKGQWHLIRAFSEVVKQYPDYKLIILGDGELKEYLQKLVNDYGLENNIELKGFVSNPYFYISNSSAFVFSSLYEGLGNSILEAMTCGTPVISTDCISGPREIIAPETNFEVKIRDSIEFAKYGVLVPVCDGKMYCSLDKITIEERLLADAIIKVINDKTLNNNYKLMSLKRSEDFDINNIIGQWREILK